MHKQGCHEHPCSLGTSHVGSAYGLLEAVQDPLRTELIGGKTEKNQHCFCEEITDPCQLQFYQRDIPTAPF
jgi:hypothetical protein